MNSPVRLGALLDVEKARRVIIHDAWSGYSSHSPIAAVYDLHRDDTGALVGEGVLSTFIAGARTVAVVLTPLRSKRFLASLASTTLIAGQYAALQTHTDDYPHVELALHVGPIDRAAGGMALLFTESQGTYKAPWGAVVHGEVFTIPGEEIGRALKRLDGPLHRKVLDSMVDASR